MSGYSYIVSYVVSQAGDANSRAIYNRILSDVTFKFIELYIVSTSTYPYVSSSTFVVKHNNARFEPCAFLCVLIWGVADVYIGKER